MTLRTIALCSATITLLSVASGDATENRLRIDVSPRISTAPAAVRVRAFVTPHAANRALEVVADSDSFYRSSLVPLDGANAAAITETVFKNLPGGEYEVSVALVAADGGRTVDKREVKVTSSLVD
jgi:hypothetical protein